MMEKMKEKERLLFWVIFLGAVLVRCIGFGAIPDGVNQDEAMAAVDAWALSKYGTDRYGTFLPVHLEAWKYGQMSALLSYVMIPFIRLFGFHVTVIRLPLLLVSCSSVALMYLIGKKMFGTRFGLLVMALTAVNPWHFMQSRWSLDCNLFPHVFLLGFYLLLLGLEKRRYLYLSMIFFGLTFYCYGIAVYSVTAFLTVFSLWCLWKKQLKCREVFFSGCIAGAIALPEILVMVINRYQLQTIATPFFTISRFAETVRDQDILFLNFSFEQLGRNLLALIKTVFLQLPDAMFNTIPAFGPLYHLSIPFILIGSVVFTKKLFCEKDIEKKTRLLAFWGTLIMGIWVGTVTLEVNVNRINIIFFPLIFLCAYGIACVGKGRTRLKKVIAAAYALCSIGFFAVYFTWYAEESRTWFYGDFVQAVQEADSMEEYDALYITGNLGTQFNQTAAEVITQFVCGIDARYYREETNINEGRELPPYGERYHFTNIYYMEEADPEGLYLFHQSERELIPFSYQVEKAVGSYVLVTGTEG